MRRALLVLAAAFLALALLSACGAPKKTVVVLKSADVTAALSPEPTQDPAQDPARSYVANKSTKRFHVPDCPSVGDMSEKNRADYEATRDEMIAFGFVPCGNCKP